MGGASVQQRDIGGWAVVGVAVLAMAWFSGVFGLVIAALELFIPFHASAGWFGPNEPSCSGNAEEVEHALTSHQLYPEVKPHLKNIRTLGKIGNILSCAAQFYYGDVDKNDVLSDWDQYYYLSLTDEGKLWVETCPVGVSCVP
jgi:hypothetical protein